MVLVRSPKRGPWLCPASPSRAAAAATAGGEAGESAKGAERGQAVDTRLTAAAPAGSEGGSFFAAAAETKGAAVVEAAGAASPSAAVAGREQAERGACFATFSPRCPARSASRLSPVSRRKSTSRVGFFSEAATHSSSGACRRPSPPAASSSEARTAAACEARTDVAAEARGVAAEVRGATTAAARETTSGTHAALPFSRSAARRLARIPSHAAADTAAAAGPAIRGEGGGSARRGPSLRHFSRAPATTGETCTNSKNESLQPQPQHATAAVSNTSVPKRMRYSQRSPLRGTSGRAETQRSTMESRGMVASFPLPRKPSTTAPAARAAAAAECQSPVHRTAAAAPAAASCSPREDVSAAATPVPRVDPALSAAGKSVSAAAAIVPSEATTSSSTAAPTAAAELLDTQQHQVRQHSVQAVELLQQLPATRALHEYVQEATRSELLRRHHGERAEATPAAGDGLGSGAAIASLAAPGTAAAAATHAAPTAARSAVAKPPATAAAAAAAAATPLAADAARAPRSLAASSGGSAAAGPTSSAVAAAAAVQIPALPAAAAGVPPNAAVASAAPASPVAAGVCVRTPPVGSAAGSAVTPAGWTGYSGDKLQQLVLPRTAEDLRREWSPTVDNVIQRLCDIREEEKQVTQFIMLEGRALRVLRHVSKALQKKRTEVAAVHATAAQQEAEQQQAHAESEKHFDIVHRQAEDAAGGQAHLERRLKDTQQKKERLLQLRRQLYEEMFACALLRQKKAELAKQLVSLKNTSAARETRRNALYQLLQRITRLRLLHSPHGHVMRAAVIPEGDNQTLQQCEEEEDLLLPAEPEDERELLLQQQQRERHEEEVQVQQQQRLYSVGAGEQQRRGREDTIDDGQHLREKSRTHVEQQVERERLGGHHHGFGETRQQMQKTFAPAAAGHSRSRQRNALQMQLPQQRGIRVEENAATESSALPVKFSAGLPMDGSMAARDRETTPASSDTDPDVFSLCTEPSIDEDDSCRRLIAAKKAGEPALVTVDCRRRDSKSGVCRDVDALWRIIEDAIGLSPE